jgi:aspartate-semialdehyde dehydrogenase
MDIFPFQYAFNLFSHNAPMTANGYNEEEMKMVKETQKIWDCNTVEIAATCIRVPVMRAHAESINLTFETELDENDARELLSKAAGLTIIDDRANNRFPTPLDATNMDNVYVGRIRQDISQVRSYIRPTLHPSNMTCIHPSNLYHNTLVQSHIRPTLTPEP